MKKSELIKIIREVAAAPVTGDAKQLEKTRTASTAISNANKRINNPTELQQAFKGWITSLGIQSGAGTEQGKAKVPYSAVRTAIEKALRELDWK
jgi:hypothetical protein